MKIIDFALQMEMQYTFTLKFYGFDAVSNLMDKNNGHHCISRHVILNNIVFYNIVCGDFKMSS